MPHLKHGVKRLVRIPRSYLEEEGIHHPDIYILVVEGDCFLPDINGGDQLILSPVEEPQRGDMVAIWHQDKKIQPMVKRLTYALPEIEKIHPDSELMPLILCEQINPKRQFAIPVDVVSAVHKVVAQFSMAAQAGWEGDGWYAYEWPGGDTFVDKINVMTKKGTVRKRPHGRGLHYDRDDKLHKLTVRVFN
jgi:hypothetical protein